MTGRMIRAAVTTAVTGLLVSLLPASSASAADNVDVPVSFAVINKNDSRVGCVSDDAPYTVYGHLTGPASKLSSSDPLAGTLYLHGLEVGEWFWRLPAVGSGYAETMADLGHVSVTVDRIGYGASGHPRGTKSCVGSQADVAHQIVQQLRAGTYTGDQHPAFGKVALAGHSLGGAITEIEAFSFHDVDAIAILAYADLALTPSTLAGSLFWGSKCFTGGPPQYAYLTRSVADYQKNFLANTPSAVLAEATSLRNLNPCGDMLSVVPAIPVDLLRVRQIKVPVLELVGNKDLVFDSKRVLLQSKLFLGSPSVTTHVVDGGTHGLTLEPTATDVVAQMHAWLGARGF